MPVMKKFALALLTATAAFTSSAFAADLPMKAPPPPPAPVYNWTGCYIGAGGGYGLWNQDVTGFVGVPATQQFASTQTNGGRGWFGTVGGGCDYQFNLGLGIPGISTMVIGVLADGDWGSIKGTTDFSGLLGSEKMSSSWDIGGRIGWLVTPQVLTYFSGGYTQARFDQVNEFGNPGGPTGLAIPAHTYGGWFLGSGLEYTTNWLPGLFWKTEYRFSEYNKANLSEVCVSAQCGPLGPTGFSVDSSKFVQTIRTELVYRFNWGGPVVGRY
jgi:outer membrane immunogenic protein